MQREASGCPDRGVPGCVLPAGRARHPDGGGALAVLPGAVVAGDRPAAHRPGRDVQVVAAAGRQGGHRDRLGHHGNVGYSAESPLQQRYRDVARDLVADGTAATRPAASPRRKSRSPRPLRPSACPRRPDGINVWCGLDADAAQARTLLASQLEGLVPPPVRKIRTADPGRLCAGGGGPGPRPCGGCCLHHAGARGRLARGRRGARRRRPGHAGLGWLGRRSGNRVNPAPCPRLPRRRPTPPSPQPAPRPMPGTRRCRPACPISPARPAPRPPPAPPPATATAAMPPSIPVPRAVSEFIRRSTSPLHVGQMLRRAPTSCAEDPPVGDSENSPPSSSIAPSLPPCLGGGAAAGRGRGGAGPGGAGPHHRPPARSSPAKPTAAAVTAVIIPGQATQESPGQVRDRVGLLVEGEVAGVEDVHLGGGHLPAVASASSTWNDGS